MRINKRNALNLIILTAVLFSCPNEIRHVYNVPKDYRLWKKPVKEILDYPVPGHGASFRVIYANELSFKASLIKDANGNEYVVLPDGAVIIKEVYKEKKDINWTEPVLTIMVKDKNNKDAQSGWLYFVRKPGEKQAALIKGRMCIGCHEAANDKHIYFDNNEKGIFRDYLFVNFIGK